LYVVTRNIPQYAYAIGGSTFYNGRVNNIAAETAWVRRMAERTAKREKDSRDAYWAAWNAEHGAAGHRCPECNDEAFYEALERGELTGLGAFA
jgi:hypothetical protein